MRILTGAALWLGFSIPLAILAGRVLRVRDGSREASHAVAMARRVPVATAVVSAAVLIVVASQALPRLPDPAMIRDAAMRVAATDAEPPGTGQHGNDATARAHEHDVAASPSDGPSGDALSQHSSTASPGAQTVSSDVRHSDVTAADDGSSAVSTSGEASSSWSSSSWSWSYSEQSSSQSTASSSSTSTSSSTSSTSSTTSSSTTSSSSTSTSSSTTSTSTTSSTTSTTEAPPPDDGTTAGG